MAFYTVKLIDLCRMYAVDGDTTNEAIRKAIPHIFDETWNTYDPQYKEILCFKILRHYMMREIGFETPDRWVYAINDELSQIMPKYNILYSGIEIVKSNLFGNVDVTETNNQRDTGTNVTNTQSSTEGNTSSNTKTNQTGSNTTTGNSTGEGNSDAWQTAQDTPQGALTGITAENYLSNAVHNRGNNSTSTETSSTGSTTAESTNTNTTTDKTTATGKVTADIENTTEYIKRITGKNSAESNIDLYNKYVESVLSIDKMIIDELNPLFMGLYE